MTLAPFFHVAVSVRDLDRAMADFAKALSLGFYPPTTIGIDSGGGGRSERRATYSREGPPFLELVEASAQEIEARGEGLHHIGAIAAGLDSFAGELLALGLTEERRIVAPDGGTIIWLNRPESFHGTRLEFFDRRMEHEFSPERLERFFAKREHTRHAAPDPPARP